MKSIEERAKEYEKKYYDGAASECRLAFIRGAQSEHEELTRWHDPKEELPEIGKDVLFRIKYPSTNMFSYQVGQLQDNGRVRLPRIELGDIVGWRPIHENE